MGSWCDRPESGQPMLGDGTGVTGVRRFIAMVLALILIATSVMPLVAEARGDVSTGHVHLTPVMDLDHDHDHEGHDTGDLVHHAHSHAQTLVPVAQVVLPIAAYGDDVRFRAVQVRAPGSRADRAPFEPPRS